MNQARASDRGRTQGRRSRMLKNSNLEETRTPVRITKKQHVRKQLRVVRKSSNTEKTKCFFFHKFGKDI